MKEEEKKLLEEQKLQVERIIIQIEDREEYDWKDVAKELNMPEYIVNQNRNKILRRHIMSLIRSGKETNIEKIVEELQKLKKKIKSEFA